MWDLIVSVPCHCLSLYFSKHLGKLIDDYILWTYIQLLSKRKSIILKNNFDKYIYPIPFEEPDLTPGRDSVPLMYCVYFRMRTQKKALLSERRLHNTI